MTATLERAWRKAFAPPERLLPSEWAERHLMLSERSTQFPGAFRFHRAPYLREIVDSLADPTVELVTACFAAQTGKTQALLAAVAYCIDQDPGPMLFVLPNADLAKSFSEQRLQPLIDDCRNLARHKPDVKDRYRKLEMHLDRMTLALVGSNSPANLASRPIRYLFCDEIDKYPAASDREAGALDLADKRTRTYWNRKRYRTSTPTLADGAIWRSYLDGDQRRYWVPCPHCGEMQTLEFGRIKWPKDAKGTDGQWDLAAVRAGAFYECFACKGEIHDRHKRDMLLAGEWRAQRDTDKHRSYQLSALYPTWVSFADVAISFIESKPYPEKLRDFVNSTLAEPWEERGDAADEPGILRHRGEYQEGHCPAKPLAVVITADVQKDSIFYVIRAWGQSETSWLIRYGQVADFNDLDYVARGLYQSIDGEMRVTAGYIDSGFRTDEVYQFCQRTGWHPVKGVETATQNQPIRVSRVGNMQLLLVKSDYYKDLLQLKLRIKLDDPGAWHLHAGTGHDYASHLAAEYATEVKDAFGRRRRVWKRLDRDNHLGDCEVYQLAAAMSLGIRYMEAPQNERGSRANMNAAADNVTRRDGRDFWDR